MKNAENTPFSQERPDIFVRAVSISIIDQFKLHDSFKPVLYLFQLIFGFAQAQSLGIMIFFALCNEEGKGDKCCYYLRDDYRPPYSVDAAKEDGKNNDTQRLKNKRPKE